MTGREVVGLLSAIPLLVGVLVGSSESYPVVMCALCGLSAWGLA